VIVLGIDPGTRRFGWGVVQKRGTKFVHVSHGVIVLGDGPLHLRLAALEVQLQAVIDELRPTHASVEGLFFAKDAQAAAKLGHARGVALMVCGRAELDVFEYAPARVKRSVTGNGQADKEQVAQMMRVVLSLKEAPVADAADALALAVTHLQHAPMLAVGNGVHPLTKAIAEAKNKQRKRGNLSPRRPV
jgi:crossover junction endodeoxyribonuclease RuvC